MRNQILASHLDSGTCSKAEIGYVEFNVFFVQVKMKNSIHPGDKIQFGLNLEWEFLQCGFFGIYREYSVISNENRLCPLL